MGRTWFIPSGARSSGITYILTASISILNTNEFSIHKWELQNSHTLNSPVLKCPMRVSFWDGNRWYHRKKVNIWIGTTSGGGTCIDGDLKIFWNRMCWCFQLLLLSVQLMCLWALMGSVAFHKKSYYFPMEYFGQKKRKKNVINDKLKYVHPKSAESMNEWGMNKPESSHSSWAWNWLTL